MKANEAPEKIYLFENPIDGTPDYRWLSKMSCSNDVEYIRKDAFIEKACEWLRNYVNPTAGTYLFDEDIEKFRKVMKGE